MKTLFGRRRDDPRAALAQVPDALAGRAAGGQHDHPGDRRRHHQDRDGALRRRAARGGPRDAARADDPRRAAVRGPGGGGRAGDARSCRRRWRRPASSTRRWWSTSAWARTGWTRSEWIRTAASPPARDGRRSEALIALQAPINSGLGKATGTLPAAAISFIVGTVLLLGIVRRHRRDRRASARPPTCAWYYLIGGLLGRRLRDDRAAHRAHARCGRRDGRDGRRPAHDVGRDRPARVPRPRRDADHARPRDRRRAAVRRHGPGDRGAPEADSRQLSGLAFEVGDLVGLVLDLVLGVVELVLGLALALLARALAAQRRVVRSGRRLPSSYGP